MTIKLVENYAVNQARQLVRESLQSHGEQCVLLAMYHPFFDPDQPHCPYCNDDVYTGSGQDCTICWGTGIQGGVKQAAKVWGMFTDHQATERYGERGIWAADAREIQTEAFPLLMEHDFVIRVRRWNTNGTPAEIDGFYGIQAVTRNSLRTGDRFGQSTSDVVGQKAQITKVSENTNIFKYPVLGVPFLAPELAKLIDSPVVIKSSPWPTAPLSDLRRTVIIGNGTSSLITVPHNLGTADVIVQLYDLATGEQVDTDVFAANLSTVTLRFGTPPAPNSLQAIIMAFGSRYAYTIGDGASTTIVVRHGLGTTNILVQLYDNDTGEQVDTNLFASDPSSITLQFQDPPAQDSLRVVIVA